MLRPIEMANAGCQLKELLENSVTYNESNSKEVRTANELKSVFL